MTDPEQSEFYRRLGAEIRSLRGIRTQESLAQAAGLTRTSIVNIEAGKQKMLLHNLFNLAPLLGLRPSEIISRIELAFSSNLELKMPEELTPMESDWIRRGVQRAIDNSRPT